MRKLQLSSLVILSAFSLTAWAHVGFETTGFMSGILHPLTGLDHLLAMFAVGLWASQVGKKAIWLIPAAFVITMAVGAALVLVNISVPYVEEGILSSVLILGILIALALKLPLIFAMLVVGFFAVFHGYAHGSEVSALSLTYGIGFILSTIALHMVGIFLGMGLKLLNFAQVARFAGILIALAGAVLIGIEFL